MIDDEKLRDLFEYISNEILKPDTHSGSEIFLRWRKLCKERLGYEYCANNTQFSL